MARKRTTNISGGGICGHWRDRWRVGRTTNIHTRYVHRRRWGAHGGLLLFVIDVVHYRIPIYNEF